MTLKSKEAHRLLENIGKTLKVNQNIFDEMTKFTIEFIYGDKLNKTLASKWNSRKTKSTQRIPPDQDSHDLHVKRVNYHAYVLLNYDKPYPLPSPLNHGWILVEGRCQPLRYLNLPLPRNLSNAVVEQQTMHCNVWHHWLWIRFLLWHRIRVEHRIWIWCWLVTFVFKIDIPSRQSD